MADGGKEPARRLRLVRWLIGAAVIGLLFPLFFMFMFVPQLATAAFLAFKLAPVAYALVFVIKALRIRSRSPDRRPDLWAIAGGAVAIIAIALLAQELVMWALNTFD